MANQTVLKFGYPDSLLREYDHWVVLLRPSQVTLGSLVLAAKGDATAFGQLPAGAHAELADITRDIEQVLANEIGYQRINYLMLMMVDPNVHFHVFPRYEDSRAVDGIEVEDRGWPGQPDLGSGQVLPQNSFDKLRHKLMQNW